MVCGNSGLIGSLACSLSSFQMHTPVWWPSNPFKHCYRRILCFPAPSLSTSLSLCKISQHQIICGSHKNLTFLLFHASCTQDIFSSWNTKNVFSYPQVSLTLLAPHHFFVYLTFVLSYTQLLHHPSWKPHSHRNSPGWGWMLFRLLPLHLLHTCIFNMQHSSEYYLFTSLPH